MIGTLGNIVFESSTSRVFTLSNMSRSGAPRFEQHDVIGIKPVLEYVAPGLDTFTFNIRLDRFLGVTPEDEIKKIREARDIGQILPFTLGGKYEGEWVIESVTETNKSMDGRGKLIVSELTITIKEYANGQPL